MPKMSVETNIQAPSGPRPMRIDVTSDVICPFCIIGVKQLQDGIATYNETHLSNPIEPLIRVLPYQLDRTMTEEPQDRTEVRRRKFGDRAEGMMQMMQAKMAAAGFDLAMTGETSSSHLAHRLQTYGLTRFPTKQIDLAMDVFRAYHEKGIHPSDKNMLSEIAVKHGLFDSEKEAQAWLDGDELDREVHQAYGASRRLGVTGVPFFVFQGKWAASGAMGTDEFVALLEEISRRETEGSTTPSPTSTAVSPKSTDQRIHEKNQHLHDDEHDHEHDHEHADHVHEHGEQCKH